MATSIYKNNGGTLEHVGDLLEPGGSVGGAGCGGAESKEISENTVLTADSPRKVLFKATKINLTVTLPDATTLEADGMSFIFGCTGENAITVLDAAGYPVGADGGVLQAGAMRIYILVNKEEKLWMSAQWKGPLTTGGGDTVVPSPGDKVVIENRRVYGGLVVPTAENSGVIFYSFGGALVARKFSVTGNRVSDLGSQVKIYDKGLAQNALQCVTVADGTLAVIFCTNSGEYFAVPVTVSDDSISVGEVCALTTTRGSGYNFVGFPAIVNDTDVIVNVSGNDGGTGIAGEIFLLRVARSSISILHSDRAVKGTVPLNVSAGIVRGSADGEFVALFARFSGGTQKMQSCVVTVADDSFSIGSAQDSGISFGSESGYGDTAPFISSLLSMDTGDYILVHADSGKKKVTISRYNISGGVFSLVDSATLLGASGDEALYTVNATQFGGYKVASAISTYGNLYVVGANIIDDTFAISDPVIVFPSTNVNGCSAYIVAIGPRTAVLTMFDTTNHDYFSMQVITI